MPTIRQKNWGTMRCTGLMHSDPQPSQQQWIFKRASLYQNRILLIGKSLSMDCSQKALCGRDSLTRSGQYSMRPPGTGHRRANTPQTKKASVLKRELEKQGNYQLFPRLVFSMSKEKGVQGVLRREKGGTLRVCIGYWNLNTLRIRACTT